MPREISRGCPQPRRRYHKGEVTLDQFDGKERFMWNLIPWKKNGGEGGALAAEPFEREFSRIRNEFDSLMQRMGSGFPGFNDEFFESRWGLDVEETDTHYVASMSAP